MGEVQHTDNAMEWRRRRFCAESSKLNCMNVSSRVWRSRDLKAEFGLLLTSPSELGTEFVPDKFWVLRSRSIWPTHSKGSQWKALTTDPQEATKYFPWESNSIFLTAESKGRLWETHSAKDWFYQRCCILLEILVSMSQKRITLSSLLVANKYSTGLKRTVRISKFNKVWKVVLVSSPEMGCLFVGCSGDWTSQPN